MSTKRTAKSKTAVTENIAPLGEEPGALIVQADQVPDYLQPQGPARGSENVGTDDVVIPRLEIVQGLSPAVKEGDPGYIEGARPGMLLNSVSNRLYGKEVMVVPVHYTKQWLVWKKRKDPATNKPLEGGFLGSFNSPEEADIRMKQAVKDDGINPGHVEIIDTPQHLCLLVDFTSGAVDEVMVSMPRTKAKISRQWNTMVRMAGGDRFARVYRVTSSLEKNARGDYYNFAIAQSGFPAKQLYIRAEKLYLQIAAGTRKVIMDVKDFDREAGGTGRDASDDDSDM